jgi:hypothetical protein
MANMLLLNPRERRASTKTRRKTRRAKARRRSNPFSLATVKRNVRRRSRRRVNTVRARRRRNPIRMRGILSGLVPMLQDAAVGAVGAVGVNMVWARVNSALPAAIQDSTYAGQAVKAVATVALGQMLGPVTRNWSRKMAAGALTVQAFGIVSALMNRTSNTAGLGYGVPGNVVPFSARVNPIPRMSAYTRGGSPLLNAYVPGTRQLLRSGMSARERDAVRG